MIDRYTRPRMKAIWELKRKYEIWLGVELAACATDVPAERTAAD